MEGGRGKREREGRKEGVGRREKVIRGRKKLETQEEARIRNNSFLGQTAAVC